VPPGTKGYIKEICAARGIKINRHVTPRGSGLKSVNFFRTGQCKPILEQVNRHVTPKGQE
jgi:hypothetical protein